jgi:tetratricopeptide (TPR) repeat protein
MALVIAACIAVGALQGARLRDTRESEAFYRWIRAAAVAARFDWTDDISQDEEGRDYADSTFFSSITEKTNDALPAHEREGESNAGRLALYADGMEHADLVWETTAGPVLREEREQFLQLAKNGELYYARDIDYVKILEGDVGLFQMFLGFRKVAANFIWLEVDRLWHQGVIHRMIPLMKTCVLLDPQFVDAYLLGSWHLAYNVTAKMQETPYNQRVWNDRHQACIGKKNQYYYFAIEFLRDGISHNEHDYRLYFDLGFGIYKEKLDDYPNAVRYLSQAVRQRHDIWVPRQLYICLELNGQYEEALAGWYDYQQRFPDTTTGTEVAPRRITRILGLVYEEMAKNLQAEAEAATDPAVAEQKRAEAAQNIEKAREKWNELQEPYAQSRLLRIEAEELRSKGRYLEAVALLDQARYIDPGDENWFACSDRIIEIKQEGGIELTLSERKAVARDASEDRCIGEPI